MACGSSRHTGVNVFCFQDTVFVVFMDNGFFGRGKRGSNLHAFRAQHESSCHSSSVGDSAGSDNRNAHSIHYLGNQRHGCDLTDMSAGLGSFRNDSVGAAAFHTFRQRGGSDYRDNLHSGSFPVSHIFLRTSRARGNHLNAFLNYNLRYSVRLRTHQHNVDAERFVCHFFRLTDLVSHPLCRSCRCGDQSQTAGVGYRRRQMTFCHPGHSSLDYRIFDS